MNLKCDTSVAIVVLIQQTLVSWLKAKSARHLAQWQEQIR